jgi:spermidine/putrescine transport system substrate-binding protein
MHPKDRQAAKTRRAFLQQAGFGAIALSSAAPLLAACSNNAAVSASTGAGGKLLGPSGLPLARPDQPVTFPLWRDPIKAGMQPERGGTFSIFNYADYLYPKVAKDFGDKYGVQVKVVPFGSMDQAVRKLADNTVDVDVMNLIPDHLDQSVAGKIVQPINHTYIPNLAANVWPELQSPFYDVGSHYTIPYTTYGTGIAWRTDKIPQDIPSMANPWDIFWHSQAWAGKVAVLDDAREAIVLALLRRHHYDVNTEDPKLINQAVKDLEQLNSICNVKVNITTYSSIPAGTSYLHHAWSGDIINAYLYYMPKSLPASALGYWSDGIGKAPVQNDCWAIPTHSKKPVLAHLFMNYILDNTVSYENFAKFNGYQPPLTSISADEIIQRGVIPESLRPAIVDRSAFGKDSLREMTLSNRGQALWQNGYSQFTSGA